jgi:hypothetical protein
MRLASMKYWCLQKKVAPYHFHSNPPPPLHFADTHSEPNSVVIGLFLGGVTRDVVYLG